MSDNPAGTAILTREQVVAWRDELAAAERLIEETQERAARLRRLLEAAAIFMPDEPLTPLASELVKVGEPTPTISDFIERLVQEATRPLTPKDIRRELKRLHPGLLSNDNYLYTAIKRLADKHRITKEGDGYVPGLFA